MIINRTWNRWKQCLEISYIDKEGKRQLYTKYLHHWKTYEYDDNGKYDCWNGRKCNAIYKDAKSYSPNEFDMLEYIFEMKNNPEEKEILDQLYQNNPIKLYTYDIETEVSDEFPDPVQAKQKVTSISLVGPDMSCYVMALKQMDAVQIARLRNRYIDFIKNNDFANQELIKQLDNGGKEPIVKYRAFATEIDLLEYWFTKIIPNITFLAGWNSYNFDRRYLVNRATNLVGSELCRKWIQRGSPTYEIGQARFISLGEGSVKIPIPMHMVELDYMLLVEKYEYAFRPYESYSLDWCGEHIVGANKIKYQGTLQQLYERDYEWYYYYNAIDSLIVQLIHKRTKCVKSPAAVGSATLVGLQDAMGQIAMTTANLFKTFYDENLHVVYDYDGINRDRPEYEGAFCCAVPGLHNWTACFDFKSLYPTQIRTCNMSFENFVHPPKIGPDSLGRYTTRTYWTEEELEKFRKDPNYFVTLNNNVYRNDKDYAFKRMQEKNTKNRDKYKYLGQKIAAQMLTEIDRVIKPKETQK